MVDQVTRAMLILMSRPFHSTEIFGQRLAKPQSVKVYQATPGFRGLSTYAIHLGLGRRHGLSSVIRLVSANLGASLVGQSIDCDTGRDSVCWSSKAAAWQQPRVCQPVGRHTFRLFYTWILLRSCRCYPLRKLSKSGLFFWICMNGY